MPTDTPAGRCAARPAPRRGAYQGAPGAFSEDAARVLLGDGVELEARATLAAVFEALADGEVDAAIVPIENSLAGAVPGCGDLIRRHLVHITAEYRHLVAHALIARSGVAIGDLRTVSSHPVALAQCARFFREHPAIKPVPAFDTAGAVAELMASRADDAGAIASRRAAEIYGGRILIDDVQDAPDNFTRFLRLERGAVSGPPHAGDKTSLVCILPHRPGALHAALGAFASRGLDLTRIESLPLADRPFEYAFFLDIGPSTSPAALEEAVDDLASRSSSSRVLGHYREVTRVSGGGAAEFNDANRASTSPPPAWPTAGGSR